MIVLNVHQQKFIMDNIYGGYLISININAFVMMDIMMMDHMKLAKIAIILGNI